MARYGIHLEDKVNSPDSIKLKGKRIGPGIIFAAIFPLDTQEESNSISKRKVFKEENTYVSVLDTASNSSAASPEESINRRSLMMSVSLAVPQPFLSSLNTESKSTLEDKLSENTLAMINSVTLQKEKTPTNPTPNISTPFCEEEKKNVHCLQIGK